MGYIRNTNPTFWKEEHRDCNCGSFALNVTSWVTPYDNDDFYTDSQRTSMIEEMYDEGFAIEDIAETVVELDVNAILRACPWLERVSLDETTSNDRVVAYRIYIDEDALLAGEIDDDYHFRVRINGFWFEKCGEEPIRFCGTFADEAPWHISPFLVYTSKVIYFRFKE